MAYFEHDQVTFHYRDTGSGLPFVFQHGLGGDIEQPMGLFSPPVGVRLLAFDCRAYGKTVPLGPEEKISIPSFADDLCAFVDHLQIERAVIGGISMGAAVAVNFTLKCPDRVMGSGRFHRCWSRSR